jgi:TolA-binding protein
MMPPRRLDATILAFLILLWALPALAGESEDFRVVQSLIQEGALQTALVQGQQYLQAYPQGRHRAEVSGWVGHLLAARGEWGAALPLLDAAFAGLPPKERAGLALDLAQARLNAGRPEEALQALAGYQAANGTDWDNVHRIEAKAYSLLGRNEQAAQMLQAIPEGRRTESDRLRLATLSSELGHDAEAVRLLDSSLAGASNPQETRRLILALASSQYRLKAYDQALKTLQPLLASKDEEATLLQAWILHDQGEDAQAYDAVRGVLPLQGWEAAADLVPVESAAVRRDAGAVIGGAKACLQKWPKGEAAAQARLLSARAQEWRRNGPAAMDDLAAAYPDLSDPLQQTQVALEAAHIAWSVIRNPDLAERWLKEAQKVAPSDALRAEVLLAQGRLRWEQGRPADAVATLSGLITTFPAAAVVPDADLLLARIHLDEGDPEQATQVLQSVLNGYPGTPAFARAALLLGESLVAEGKEAQLGPLLAQLAQVPLDSEQAARKARLAGLLALHEGQWDRAQREFAESVPIRLQGRAADEALFRMGVAELGAGEVEAALKTAERLSDPTLADALRFRSASALDAGGNHAQAWALWSELAQGGQEPIALWELAGSQMSHGAPAPGLSTLQKLASLQDAGPLATLAQHRLEMTLLAQQGAEAALMAIPAFRAAEPTDPGQAAALLRSARIKARSKDAAGAEKAYQSYLQRFPGGPGAEEAELFLARRAAERSDWSAVKQLLSGAASNAEAQFLLGQAEYRTHHNAAALATLERLLASPGGLAPEEINEAQLLAGKAAQADGNAEAAAAHLAAYGGAEPVSETSKDDLMNAALFLQHQGKYEEAAKILQRLGAVFKDASIGFQYAYTLELWGKPDQALSAYLRVAFASANPQWALTARYRAAELMLSLGRRQDAISLYKQLAARTKGTVQGDYAERRLEELEGPSPPKGASQGPPAAVENPEKQPPLAHPSPKKPATKGKSTP